MYCIFSTLDLFPDSKGKHDRDNSLYSRLQYIGGLIGGFGSRLLFCQIPVSRLHYVR